MMIAIVIFEIKLLKSGIQISDLYLADSDHLNMNSAGDAIIFFNFNASDNRILKLVKRISNSIE